MPSGVYKRTNETRKILSLAHNGKKRGYSGMSGKKHSIETRKKLSLAISGEKHYNWQGGKTEINKKIRRSLEYKLWRESVFKRDNWTCVFCLEKESVSGKLQADHIKPFAFYPELRFAIDNGRTLCIDCHKTTDTYFNKIRWSNK